MKCDESETKIFTTESVHGQSTLHDLLLQTITLKITFECAVIAPTNYVNLTTGGRRGKGLKILRLRITSKNKDKKLILNKTRWKIEDSSPWTKANT